MPKGIREKTNDQRADHPKKLLAKRLNGVSITMIDFIQVWQ